MVRGRRGTDGVEGVFGEIRGYSLIGCWRRREFGMARTERRKLGICSKSCPGMLEGRSRYRSFS